MNFSPAYHRVCIKAGNYDDLLTTILNHALITQKHNHLALVCPIHKSGSESDPNNTKYIIKCMKM